MLKSGRGRRSFLGGRGLQPASAGFATIEHIGTTYGGNDVTSLPIAYPANIQAGDLILAWRYGNNFLNNPAGFTTITSVDAVSNIILSYKRAVGNESGTNATFTQSTTSACFVSISAFRNVSESIGFIEDFESKVNDGTLVTSMTLSAMTILPQKRTFIAFGSSFSYGASSVNGTIGSYTQLLNTSRITDMLGGSVYMKETNAGLTSETTTFNFTSIGNFGGACVALVPKSL